MRPSSVVSEIFESFLDVRSEDEKCDLLKLLDNDEEKQQQDHANAALFQALAELHRVGLTNTWQQVVGQNKLLGLLCLKATRLFVENH